jgi:hypothetical protein
VRFFAAIGIIVAVVFVLVFGFAFLASLEKASNTNAPPNYAAASTAIDHDSIPAMDVSPVRLFADYRRNEVRADQRSKGRQLRVTSAVESINKDASGTIYLTFAGDGFMWFHASMRPSEASHAGDLTIAQQDTVVCLGGTMIIGGPMLDDCIFEDSQAPTAMRLSAPPLNNESNGSFPNSEAMYRTPIQPKDQAPQYQASAPAPIPTESEAAYDDAFLSAVKAHRTVPQGVPVGRLRVCRLFSARTE